MLTVSRSLAPLALAAVTLVVLAVPAVAASERGDKPLMKPTPSHVETPRDHPERGRRSAPHHTAEKGHADTHEKININTADVKALMTLTGVGRKVAEKIVEYRDTHGPFKKAEEFRKVDGVGSGVWEKNRERIVIK